MKRKATKLLSAAMSAVVLLSNGAVYASEEQQNKEKTVSSWEWTENEYLSETENGWELQISDLDGAEKLTREALKELLPTSVMAEIREEAEEKQEADPTQEEEPEAEGSQETEKEPEAEGGQETEEPAAEGGQETEEEPAAEDGQETEKEPAAEDGQKTEQAQASPEEAADSSGQAEKPEETASGVLLEAPLLTEPVLKTEEKTEAAAEELQLTWDLSAFPETGWSADSCTVTASLPDGYVLAEGVPEPAVTVKASEVAVLTDHDHSAFEKYTVDGFTPAGTSVDLFDYWTASGDAGGREAADDISYGDAARTQQGINAGHAFKFGKGMGQLANGEELKDLSVNHWTGSTAPRTGIVKNTLGNDGYPVFVENLPAAPNDSGTTDESTAYLFEPRDEDGKLAFSNVEGLFQTDSDGYYYYDSQKNFAWFDEDEDEGRFKLYNTWGVQPAGGSSNGQFFPFDGPGEVFEVDASGNPELTGGDLTQKEKDELDSQSSTLNHYFGLSMTTRFIQKNGGMIRESQPVTYQFSGDDDVWVFIDDVLVVDLGGIHDRASMSIDFSTGKIQVNGQDAGTIKERFESAGKEGDVSWNTESGKENTFADGTIHTLKFFYLERGNTDSNMMLKYNLQPIPESEITKLDQEGNPVSGVVFALYPAEVLGDDYKIKAGYENKPIFTGKTESNGLLRMLDKDGTPHTFGDFYEKCNTRYFILRETSVLDGYHAAADTCLRYDPETGLIFSDHYWETGSYGEPKVTTTASTILYKAEGANQGQQLVDLSTTEPMPDMYAVVFKRLDMSKPYTDEDNWAPVSGSAAEGWTIHNSSSMEDNILEAVQANGGKNKFELATGGAFQVTVEDLPGSIENYYWYLEQKGNSAVEASKVEYTVNYYYKDKDGSLIRLYTDEFQREFAVHIYVSNIRNYLIVEKVNEKGQAMNGAGFALYLAEDVEKAGAVSGDGTVDYNRLANLTPYDQGTTASLHREPDGTGDKVTGEGMLVFPSTKDFLKRGTYYLIETSSGDTNYFKNPKAVQVIVDETGVYADAGTADDGITTGRAVGSIVKGMLRFVRDDGIDASLHNIRIQLLTSPDYSYGGAGANWSSWEENPDPSEEQHLYYNGNRSGDGLGLEYSPTNGQVTLTARTETGWNRLAVRQCLEHYESTTPGTDGACYTENGSKVQDLKTQDISGVFSSVMYVTVENQPVHPDPENGKLAVSKTVKSAAEDPTEFRFEISLRDGGGNPLSGSYSYVGETVDSVKGAEKPQDGSLTFDAQGKASFVLKHGQKITILDLPAGTQYQIREIEKGGYVVSSEGASGTIESGKTSEAVFVNQKQEAPSTDNNSGGGSSSGGGSARSQVVSAHTGDSSQPVLWLVLMLLAAGGAGIAVLYMRKKRF